jgi:hypothetical protein
MSLDDQLRRLNRPRFQPVSPKWLYAVSKDGQDGNLSFCWIEKVGCTMMKGVFRQIQQHVDVTWKGNEVTSDVLKGRHKAVLLRDPLSRFLSGWLDKCRGKQRIYCVRLFGGEDVSFRDAVFLLPRQYPRREMDNHFLPQHLHCGGMYAKKLKEEFTVGYLDSSVSIADSVRKMLESSGFGFLPESKIKAILPEKRAGGHAADANQKMVEYYAQWGDHNGVADQDEADLLIATAVDFFLEDYLALGMEVPLFAMEALHRLRNNADHPWSEHAFTDDMMDALTTPNPYQKFFQQQHKSGASAIIKTSGNPPHTNQQLSQQQQQHRSGASAITAITASTTKTSGNSGSKSSSYRDELDPYYNAVIEDLDKGNRFDLFFIVLSVVILYEAIRRGLGTATHRMLSKAWRNKTKTDDDNDTDTTSRMQSGRKAGNTRRRRLRGAQN